MFRTAGTAALLLALLASGSACASSLYSGRGPRPGPDVLYAPATFAPQLENTGIWSAPPILISGATAYRDGEFLYQDWLYDDLGAGDAYVYPADARYAGNAADLVELRIKPLAGETAIRLTFNSMADPSVMATTIALGNSNAAIALPHGANAKAPGRVFVTVHGDSADAVDAITGLAVNDALPTAVDVARRQVEVRVPHDVFDTRGEKSVRVAAASGLWDPAANAYQPQAAAAFFNVAFRGDEPSSAWRTNAQSAALAAGDLSPFFARVDFTKLEAGTDDERDVPVKGFMNRILVSAGEDRQGRGDTVSRKPGCEAPCALQLSGRLQPYAVYVPPGPAPEGGYGLTIDLHGCGQTYNIGFGRQRQRQLGERNRIVLTPEARGDCYWYFGQAAADVFETWADVARLYTLDPDVTAITGTSMGGYGALKLAASYPDLFSRAAVTVPCPGAGIAWTGVRGVPGGEARSLLPVLPSLRNVPVMSWQTTDDITCVYADQMALIGRLDALGYRYASWTFSGQDHNMLAITTLSESRGQAEFLGDARIERNPRRVSFVVNPAMSETARGLAADHAYWLSDVIPLSATAPGTVHVLSEGLGREDPGPSAAVTTDGTLPGGLPYSATSRLDGAASAVPSRRRLSIAADGVSSITIDVLRARTGCAPTMDVDGEHLLRVRLDGCNTTYAIKRVCHATPVFDVVVRAPRSERPRSAKVVFGGRALRIRRHKVRIDVKGRSRAMARVRVASVDGHGRTIVRATSHRWCPAR